MIYYILLCNPYWLVEEWSIIKKLNFIRFKSKYKVQLKLDRRQVDLVIKSLYITQCVIKREDPDINLLFKDKNNDFDKLFYLQRFIGATANRQLYNTIDNCYFIKER